MDAFTVSSPLKLTQLQDQCMSIVNNDNTAAAQIHTIMLNGQPALFIPASSSNALLCQMLMSNTAANNQPQIYQLNEIQQPQAIQLNANDLANFLVAASNSNANHVNLGLNNIQLGDQNGTPVTYIQLPTSTTNVQQQVDLNQQQLVVQKTSKRGRKPYGKKVKVVSIPQMAQISQQQQQQQQDEDIANNLAQELNSLYDQHRTSAFDGQQQQPWAVLDQQDQQQHDESGISTNTYQSTDIQNSNEKRKRRACECPNCLAYKQLQKCSHSTDNMFRKRTHKCHKCNKEYNKTSHLRAHLRAHENIRPYKCDFKSCEKSFTRSDELKRHKRIHNDDRNFVCPICKKKFLRSDHLSKHLLVHNKQTMSLHDRLQKQKEDDEANGIQKELIEPKPIIYFFPE